MIGCVSIIFSLFLFVQNELYGLWLFAFPEDRATLGSDPSAGKVTEV
jgi:hypothetical protein